jgi:hypothetical protein
VPEISLETSNEPSGRICCQSPHALGARFAAAEAGVDRTALDRRAVGVDHRAGDVQPGLHVPGLCRQGAVGHRDGRIAILGDIPLAGDVDLVASRVEPAQLDAAVVGE